MSLKGYVTLGEGNSVKSVMGFSCLKNSSQMYKRLCSLSTTTAMYSVTVAFAHEQLSISQSNFVLQEIVETKNY